jgi:hypothetical protein
MPPLTANPLNRTWLRLTGRNRWPIASATLTSREWTAAKGVQDQSAGHWQVEYEYSVNGARYRGRFDDFVSNDDDYPRVGAPIEIRHHPRRPGKSYYPRQHTQTAFLLVCIVFGILMVALVMLVALQRHSPLQ